MKTLYQILGLKPGAAPEELKRAYYLLAKQYHPDSGDHAEVKKFYQITEAYQILSDSKKRGAYDETLRTGKIAKGWSESDSSETVVYSRPTHEQDPVFREQEMHRYRHQMFLQAVFKIIITIFVGAVAGNTLALILNGSRLLGVVAGFSFALVWSVNRHFDLSSFMGQGSLHFAAKWSGRLIETMSLLYFGGLFFYHLWQATH